MRSAAMTTATLVCICSSIAYSNPFTYEFTYGAWDENGNEPLFGSNPVLTITLDNGSTSNLSQSYHLDSHIVSFSIATVGGSFSNTWSGDEIYIHTGVVDFINTTDDGTAILDLASQRSSRIVFSNNGGSWQFGARSSYTMSWLTDMPFFGGDRAFHDTDEGFILTGTLVPAPGSFASLASVGLFALRRRRKI
jgi:hypothetical protein